MLTNLNLTDVETCYKLFKTNSLQCIDLKENRFGIEIEITAKISRLPGVRIFEVGISYYGRTYAEGKKINWKDGLWAIYCILRYNLFFRADGSTRSLHGYNVRSSYLLFIIATAPDWSSRGQLRNLVGCLIMMCLDHVVRHHFDQHIDIFRNEL